jgi:hypothetical protein
MLIRTLLAAFALGTALAAIAKDPPKPRATGISVQLTATHTRPDELHWKITNASNESVFVYSYFLYGPAYSTEAKPGKIILDTLPPSPEPGCPNRFPPVLLLMVPSGDYRDGDFRDPALKALAGQTVSFKIGAGLDPYGVVEEANRIRWKSGNCSKSPYDAIFEWATIFESNSVKLPNLK